MKRGHRMGLQDRNLSPILLLVFLFISSIVRGQAVYRPSNTGYFTPANKPYSPATPIPTDGRTYKADTVNGLFRPYNGTSEVLTYLPTGSQYRVGQFPIVINVGGTLQSNGLFVGGQIQVWWFLRGQADTNLVRMDSTGSGTCTGCLLKANNLSDVQSLLQTLINLNLNNVDNTSDVTKWAATATLTNKSISGITNTFSNIPNSALSNNSIGLTLDTAGSSPSVSPTPAALGTSLGLHIPWAGVNSGLLKASVYAFFNGKLDSVHISNDSVYNCVNGTCTLQSVLTGGVGAVLSVSNSDGSLRFSPTTGNVIGSINTANSNIWTGQQTFNTASPIFGTLTTNGGVFYGNGSGLLLQTTAGTTGQIFESQGSSGPIFFSPGPSTINGWLGYTALSNVLGSTHIFIGNGSNVATDVAVSQDLSLTNTGIATVNGLKANALPALAPGDLAWNGSAWFWDQNVDTIYRVPGIDSIKFVINGRIHEILDSAGGGAGAVSSVSNSDGTLTISPTTGAVVASLALGHANTWTGAITANAGLGMGSNVTFDVDNTRSIGTNTVGANAVYSRFFSSDGLLTLTTSTSNAIIFAPNNVTRMQLAVSGQLQLNAYTGSGFSGTSNDSILTINPANGQIGWKWGQPYTIYAVQGMSSIGTHGDSLQWGGSLGPLFQPDTIFVQFNHLIFANMLGESVIAGTDSLMMKKANGELLGAPVSALPFQSQLSGTGYVKFAGTSPSYLTATQVTADLNLFTSSLQGLTPSSGGGTTNFLRADGTWAAPAGGGGSPGGSSGQVQYNNLGAFAGSPHATISGGEFLTDTNYINGIGAYVADKIRNVGTSYTFGIGASDFNSDYASIVDNILRAVMDNHGISSLTLQNDAPLNPWGAATNGVADTVNIPAPSGYRLVTMEYGINDYRWIGTNWDTVHFKAEYREVIHAYYNKGWTASELILLTPVVLNQGQFNADSVAHSFTSACTPARGLTYVDAVKKLGVEFGIKVVDVNAAFANFPTAMLLASDSIHPTDQGHLLIAQVVARVAGYNIVKQNQQFIVNAGLAEVDSFKIRLLGNTQSKNFTPLIGDSSGNIYGCPNCFPINNPSQAQPFYMNTSLGINSAFDFPKYLSVTGLRSATGVGGISMLTNGLQFEASGGTGYIDYYNYLTSTAGIVNIGYKGGSLAVGSGASVLNAAQLTVAGIFDVSGAAWFNSTNATSGARYLNGFWDAMSSAGTFTFRTNSAANTNLQMLANSNNLFSGLAADSSAYVELPAATATNAQIYFKPSAVDPTIKRNGQFWYDSVTNALNFQDGATTVNLLASGGGGVTGSGTTGFIPKWASSTSLGNSNIFTTGSTVTITSGTGYASYFYSGSPAQYVRLNGSTTILNDSIGFTSVGGTTQVNSAIFNVNGVANFNGATWLGSANSSTGVRVLNSFFDEMAAATDMSFRTNAASLYTLLLFHTGRAMSGSSVDEGTAQFQSLSTTLPQLGLHYDATHYTTFQINSTGVLGIHGTKGIILTDSALGVGNLATDSIMAFRYSATGDTLEKLPYPSFTNGLTNTAGVVALGGTLTNATTTINLGTNTLSLLGTGGGIINLFASLDYNYTATSDANYTVTEGVPVYYLFNGISANRTITLPSASTDASRVIVFYNQAPSFTWSFASTVNYPAGGTLTTLAQNTWYTIMSIGGIWVVQGVYTSNGLKTSADLTGQTAAVGTVASFAVPGSGSFNTYRVGGYVAVTAVSLDVIQLQVQWTDETSTSRTQSFFVQGATTGVSTTGFNGYSPIDIRVKQGTTITMATVLTTGTGSITYDVGASIIQLY